MPRKNISQDVVYMLSAHFMFSFFLTGGRPHEGRWL
jgi:hypothetical protein